MAESKFHVGDLQGQIDEIADQTAKKDKIICNVTTFTSVNSSAQADRKQVLEYIYANTEELHTANAYIRYKDSYHANYIGLNAGAYSGAYFLEILEWNHQVNLWYINNQGVAQFIRTIATDA